MVRIILAFLGLFVATGYTKPTSNIVGPFKIHITALPDDICDGNFVLNMKVQKGSRILGLGNCSEQSTDFKGVTGSEGGTTKMKIMSHDQKYVLTNKLVFESVAKALKLTDDEVYFKLEHFNNITGTTLRTMSFPHRYIEAVQANNRVKLVNRIDKYTSFTIGDNSICNDYKIYCID